MKNAKKYLSILTAIVLLSGILPVDVSMAAKKVALSNKKLTVTAGKTKTLKLKNNKKSVKWTVISGKKNVQLKSKKKTSVKIVAKKKGTAKVQAKVGKKKYVCTVKVKTSSKSVSRQDSAKATPKPDVSNTKATPKPDASNTNATVTSSPGNSSGGSLDASTSKKVSISWHIDGKNYVFLKKGQKLVNKGNTNLESGEVDVSNMSLCYFDVKYENGVEEKKLYASDAVYDFSRIDYEQIGTYNLKISWDNCSCEVPVIIAEEKTEGIFSYLTDGNVAELCEMRGDRQIEEDQYEYSSKIIELPESLNGAKVVQGVPNFLFSCDEIEKIKFPQYYSESTRSIVETFSGRHFPSLKEIIVENQKSGYVVKDNVLFAENGKILCLYPGGLTEISYRVPDGVEEGAAESVNVSIRYNKYLEEITYPVSYIGNILRVPGTTWTQWGQNLPNLKAINVVSGNPYWYSEDGVLYRKDDNDTLVLVAYPSQKRESSFTVKENVSGVLSDAMVTNSFLENIIFKSPKTYVGIEALNGDSVRNIYLDCEYANEENVELYISPSKFAYEEDEGEYPNIYIRDQKAIEYIAKQLQDRIKYM